MSLGKRDILDSALVVEGLATIVYLDAMALLMTQALAIVIHFAMHTVIHVSNGLGIDGVGG